MATKQSASQDFLDSQQYAINSVRRYEKIFGKHFISTGGLETTREITEKIGLKPGQKVLDVGCGIGGSLFYMAQVYGIHGHGIDLSRNMLGIAKESLKTEFLPPVAKITLELNNVEQKEFPAETFDVIYSRDAILHIYDKLSLFKKFYKWLKPGGKLVITDYCCGPKPHDPEFVEYLKQREYHLVTIQEYADAFQKAGFITKAEDKTNQFISILKRELKDFTADRNSFIKEFSAEDYHHIVEGWEAKVVRCSKGDHRWGLFFGIKPNNNNNNGNYCPATSCSNQSCSTTTCSNQSCSNPSCCNPSCSNKSCSNQSCSTTCSNQSCSTTCSDNSCSTPTACRPTSHQSKL